MNIILLTILNIILFVISFICFVLANKIKKEASDYLYETHRIIANNNRLMRETMIPIKRDGTINKVYFTNHIIEVVDEHQTPT